MRRTSRWAIPDDVIVPAANRMIRDTGRCADNFTTYEVEKVREQCGSLYAGVPTDDVRSQLIRLRKANKTLRVKGHGPGEKQDRSPELEALYRSDYWEDLSRRVRAYWGNQCAICKSSELLEVHHNTYKRLGKEEFTDLIAVCRKCHKICDKRRRIANGMPVNGSNGNKRGLFPGTDS